MPVGSITNNFGYQFDLTKSCEDTLKIQVKDKFGIDQGAAEYLHIADLTSEEHARLEACPNESKKKLIQEFAENRLSIIRAQTPTGKSYRVQYYIHEGHRWVILGNSGLLGGIARRSVAIGVSALQIAGAAAITIFSGGATLPLLGAAGLAGGGLKSLFYSATTPEEALSFSGHMTQSASGFAGGVGGAVAAAIVTPIASGSIAGTIAQGMVGSLGQSVGGSVTEAVIHQDASILEKQLSPQELAKTAIIGSVTGIAGSQAKNFAQGTLGNVASQSSTLVRNPVLTATAIGGMAGAASNLCTKTIENLIKIANFLDISDRAPSAPLVPDRLYVYPRSDRDVIMFLSITNREPSTTEIANLSGFKLSPQEVDGVQFSALLDKLRKGKVDLSKKEKEMILKSAYKQGHIPPSITKDFGQAATIGAISGAATQLGTIAGSRIQQRQAETTSAPPPEKLPFPERKPPKDLHPPKYEQPPTRSRAAEKIESLLKVRPTPLKERHQNPRESKILPLLDKVKTTVGDTLLNKGKAPVIEEISRRVTRSLTELAKREALATAGLTDKIKTTAGNTLLNKGKAPVIEEISRRVTRSLTELAKREALATAGLTDKIKTIADNTLLNKGKAPVIEETSRRMTRSLTELAKKGALAIAGRKRSRDVKDENGRPLKVLKGDAEKNASSADKKPDTQKGKSASPSEVQAIQGEINLLEQQQVNLKDLSTFSPTDIENKATEIYNKAKDARTGNYETAHNIGQQLSDLYGIPVGSHDSSLEEAFKGRNKDTNVVRAIMDILKDEQATKAVSNRVDQNLTEAKANLQCSQDPTCAWTPLAQLNTTLTAPPNIKELVTDSENVARISGFEGNINVETYFLSTYLAGGVDHGPLFNAVHNQFTELRSYWETHSHEKGAPTQYGFLTFATDLILNGESTVPVEKHHDRWYNKVLDTFGGKISVGVQTDGENHTIGTMDRPDLFSLPLSGTTNSEKISSMNDSSKSSSSGTLTTEQYAKLEIASIPLKYLDNIPGAQGLGTYAKSFAGKLLGFLGFMDRLADPNYQDAPFLQRIACAGTGSAFESIGSSLLAPVNLFLLLNPEQGMKVLAKIEQGGDGMQGTCNEIGNRIRN